MSYSSYNYGQNLGQTNTFGQTTQSQTHGLQPRPTTTTISTSSHVPSYQPTPQYTTSTIPTTYETQSKPLPQQITRTTESYLSSNFNAQYTMPIHPTVMDTPCTSSKRLLKEMIGESATAKQLDFSEGVKENTGSNMFQSPQPKSQPLFEQKQMFKSPQPTRTVVKAVTPKFAEPSPIRPNRHVNTEDDVDMRQVFNALDTSGLNSSSMLEQDQTVRNKVREIIFWQNPVVSGIIFGLCNAIFGMIFLKI
jgi:hypothetical protein